MAGLLAALALGCAALRPTPPPPWPLPDPALAPFRGQIQQSVQLVRGADHFEFLAVLEGGHGVVTLVGLSPLGQRLVKAVWDAQGVTVETAPGVAADFKVEQALRDLVFATWSPASLQAALQGSRWSFRLAGGMRELSADGRLVLRSHMDAGAQGPVQVLDHVREGYQVRVRDLPPDE